MKIVVYGLEKRTGVLHGGDVVDIAGAVAKQMKEKGNEPGALALAEAAASSDLGRLIEGGKRALDHVAQALDHLDKAGERTGVGGGRIVFPVAEVDLHAPQARGARVACAGGNFADHAGAMAERAKERGEDRGFGGDPREEVRKRGRWGFWKVNRDSLGQDGAVPYPARTDWLDYEGEAAIVIGKPGKNIREGDIAAHVWGVTLLGDWSARLTHEPGPMKFALQKNFDGSCSIGPCIAVGEADFNDIAVETLVNGDLRQSFSTRDMVYSFGEYLEFLARDFTFYPGDILAGGTAAGTAADSSPIGEGGKPKPDRFLKPGDTVEIRSPAVGTLRTRIVATQG
ncbi:MAG: FAA hydrolase family protein [Alphaproteobacteria bacterium]|nr:FAA hydrolase family protein [Alphaproteobacteria bacterium]